MTDEARDVIVQTLRELGHAAPWEDRADAILAALTAAGYVLLSPKEAEQERDLERLATAAGMRAGR